MSDKIILKNWEITNIKKMYGNPILTNKASATNIWFSNKLSQHSNFLRLYNYKIQDIKNYQTWNVNFIESSMFWLVNKFKYTQVMKTNQNLLSFFYYDNTKFSNTENKNYGMLLFRDIKKIDNISKFTSSVSLYKTFRLKQDDYPITKGLRVENIKIENKNLFIHSDVDFLNYIIKNIYSKNKAKNVYYSNINLNSKVNKTQVFNLITRH